MKTLIVTVAGMSSRFSQSIGVPTLKCIYSKKSIQESLLFRLLDQDVDFDKYIIVGGYKYNELKRIIETEFGRFQRKIELVENPYFKEYGSGYSLYCGLKKALELNSDEIVFAEGDLFVDAASYAKVCNSDKSVITVNKDPILANKTVALYFDVNDVVHYIYDTGHKALVISEPFLGIYNSGQIWKFSDMERVGSIFDAVSDIEWQGTNLVFVERYFQSLPKDEMEMVFFDKWINCNTVDDFNKI